MKSKLAWLFVGAYLLGGNLSVYAESFQLGTEQTHVIPPALQAGATFNEANLPRQNINGWYRIPHWFAGTTERTQITSAGGGSIKDIRRRERGRQLDAKGHVWEARREPIRYDIEEKQMIVHTVLTEELPLKVARDQVIMRYSALMICEGIKNHRIVKSFQTEQIHVFTPNPDGSISATIDQALYFNAAGVYQNSMPTRASYIERKIAPFAPVDRDDKFDYRNSFAQFLQSSGQADLIPQQYQPAPYQAPIESQPLPVQAPIQSQPLPVQASPQLAPKLIPQELQRPPETPVPLKRK